QRDPSGSHTDTQPHSAAACPPHGRAQHVGRCLVSILQSPGHEWETVAEARLLPHVCAQSRGSVMKPLRLPLISPPDGASAADRGCAPEEDPAVLSRGRGVCKWFNMRMGFGFLSMSCRDGAALDQPLDVFVHQSKLHMDGFRSLREGEAVEFTFKKSSKGLESVWVTGPNGAPCLGTERKPKSAQKRRSKGDRSVQPEHAKLGYYQFILRNVLTFFVGMLQLWSTGPPAITPKSVSCPLSPKSVISVRVCPTWWPAVRSGQAQQQHQQQQQQQQQQHQHRPSPGSQGAATSRRDEEEEQSQAILSEDSE
ncbi:hypothetical protein L3Q82_014747, partial [Scortum barcoo]